MTLLGCILFCVEISADTMLYENVLENSNTEIMRNVMIEPAPIYNSVDYVRSIGIT